MFSDACPEPRLEPVRVTTPSRDVLDEASEAFQIVALPGAGAGPRGFGRRGDYDAHRRAGGVRSEGGKFAGWPVPLAVKTAERLEPVAKCLDEVRKFGAGNDAAGVDDFGGGMDLEDNRFRGRGFRSRQRQNVGLQRLLGLKLGVKTFDANNGGRGALFAEAIIAEAR